MSFNTKASGHENLLNSLKEVKLELERTAGASQSYINIISDYVLNSITNQTTVEYSNNIKIKTYIVEQGTYYYEVKSDDISALSIFTDYTGKYNTPDNLPLCICEGMLTQVKYSFELKNQTIAGMLIEYFLEDIDGACNDQEYIGVNYSYDFIESDKVSFFIKI